MAILVFVNIKKIFKNFVNFIDTLFYIYFKIIIKNLKKKFKILNGKLVFF